MDTSEYRWFTHGKDGWTFNTSYWDRKFDDCEDIFEGPNGAVIRTAREKRP